MSLRLQSFSEVGDKSMEEKDPISHGHGEGRAYGNLGIAYGPSG